MLSVVIHIFFIVVLLMAGILNTIKMYDAPDWSFVAIFLVKAGWYLTWMVMFAIHLAKVLIG